MENTIKTIEQYISSIKDLSHLNEMSNTLINMINERKNYLTMIEEGRILSKKNYGYIKEAFENIAPKLYNSNEGRNIIKKYINEVKNNKSLASLYHIYENIYHSTANVDINYFIENTFNDAINSKELNEGINNTGRILAEAYFCIDGDFDFSSMNINEKLNESIEYLATSKKSLKNISERSSCVSEIKNYISENAGKNIRNNNTPSNISEIVESYNQKYSDIEDIETLKNIINSDNKSSLFEEYKSSCLKSIKEMLDRNADNVNIDRLNYLYEAIEKKQFNEETINKDIANFIELKNKVEED